MVRAIIESDSVGKGGICRCWGLIFLVIFMGAVSNVAAQEGGQVYQEKDTDPHRMGLLPPSAEDLAWEAENETVIREIRLNRLGRERVEAALEKRGLSGLAGQLPEAVEFGSEIVGIGKKEMEAELGVLGEGEIIWWGDDFGAEALPSYVDNSTLKYFPPIRSQGGIGSCAQFSTIYYVVTHMTALARDWDAKSGGNDYRFSPKWTYNMVNGGSDSGSSTLSGIRIAMKHGPARWSKFPYDSDYREWCRNANVWRDAINYRCQEYGYVYNLHDAGGRENLKALLADGYVVVFCTNVSDWDYGLVYDDPATPDDDPFVGEIIVDTATSTSSNHCMTVAGYNDDLWCDLDKDGVVDGNEKGAFLIANSWGSGWKNDGFVWFSYGVLKDGVWSGNGAKWILARSSYTPELLGQFTLYHGKRNDLTLQLGISDTSESLPTTYWYPEVIDRDGGAYAFDGTSTACSGSFCFDFTDLAPSLGSRRKFYLRVWDRYVNKPATLEGYKLIDVLHGDQEVVFTGVPQSVDNGSIYAAVEHTFMADGSMVVDNQDGNTSSTGAWYTSSGPDPWEGESLYSSGTATFRWIPNVVEEGVYKVYAWWTYASGRATDVPYSITHLTGSSEVIVNQRDSSLGGQWNLLGTYEFAAGSAGYVEVGNGSDGSSCADAVRLAKNKGPTAYNQNVNTYEDIGVNIILTGSDHDVDPLNFTVLTDPDNGVLSGGAPNLIYTPDSGYLGPDSFTFEVDDGWATSSAATVSIEVLVCEPNEQIIDNQDDNTYATGSWGISSGPDPWAGESLYSAGTASFGWLPLWHLPEDISYKVYAWWTQQNSQGTDVPYTISHAWGTTEVTVDQLSPPLGGQWNFIGNYMFGPGEGSYVEVGTTGSGSSCADAVKLIKNQAPTADDIYAIACQGKTAALTMTATDVDDSQLNYTVVTPPAHGQLSGTGAAVNYTPDPCYYGEDSFIFKADDGALESNEATLFITVIQGLIELSASEFDFYGYEGGENPADQVLTIRNIGGGILRWKISESCSWLWADPNSGSSGGELNEVALGVDTTGLSIGDYGDELTITDPCAYNSPQTVRVNLHVLGPVIEVSATEFDFIAQKGGANPGDQILFIGNVGGGTLEWRIEEDCDWLTAEPDSGITTSEPNEVMLKVDISGLSEGVYDGELTIIDPCALNSPQTVAVNLHVHIEGELHVPAEYPTIQAAIDASAVGDTVIVEPATYNENIDFKGKNITVTSTDPYDGAVMAGTVIDGGGTASVVTFAGSEEPNCVLIGFTITGGFTTGDGGGIKGKGTLATISRCLIINNGTASDGGGLSRCNGLISECVISGNVSQRGGGLADCGGTIISCLISDNHASNYGGGLHNCNGYIASCTVAGNDADISGVLNYCSGEFTNCIIWGNTPATIRNCTASFSFSCLEWYDEGMGNIDADPHYADAANGDYHLRSQAGRWDPGSQLWVFDACTSIGIDTGNPGCSLGTEPANNNLRKNMGVYGGTDEASKSPAVWGLLADVNNDGWVNLEDFNYQTSNWLISENEQPGDLNRDGVINISDLLLLWSDWLKETVWY